MRELVYEILSTDGPFTAIIPLSRIKQLGGIQNIPDIAAGPWCGIRMMPTLPGMGPDEPAGFKGVHLQEVMLWVYDVPQYYERIDKAQKAARAALLSAAPRSIVIADGSTVRLQCATWEGESEDQYDDQWRASTRNQSFRLTGSGI
jgi:hypothetical protein